MGQGGSPGTTIRLGLPEMPQFATTGTVTLTFLVAVRVVTRHPEGQQRAPYTRSTRTFSEDRRTEENPPQCFEAAGTCGKTSMDQQIQGLRSVLNYLSGNQGMVRIGIVFIQNAL
jgi:hypothetical protein